MSEELPESPKTDIEARRQTVVLLAVLVEGGLLAAASMLGWMVDQPPLRFFDWTLGAVLWGAAATLPLLTYVLTLFRPHLDIADELLVYLVVVVAITVLGGFWPAVLAAVASSLLLNWYFTEPIHTFTIQQPRELLALLLFVTVAVAVSSIVHLAARRAVQAARSKEEAAALLELAQTVLGGADSPAAILDHLTRTHGGQAELQERTGGRWVRVASSGIDGALPVASRIDIRNDLALLVTGQETTATPALLAGYAAQAHKQSIPDFLLHIIPTSFVGAFVEPDVLPVLLISLLTAVALASGGMVVGRLTGRPVLRSGVRQLALGALAVAVTFSVGHLIGSHSG